MKEGATRRHGPSSCRQVAPHGVASVLQGQCGTEAGAPDRDLQQVTDPAGSCLTWVPRFRSARAQAARIGFCGGGFDTPPGSGDGKKRARLDARRSGESPQIQSGDVEGSTDTMPVSRTPSEELWVEAAGIGSKVVAVRIARCRCPLLMPLADPAADMVGAGGSCAGAGPPAG
ncbi:hypothetical protein GCM10027563_33730 [Parasphingorhabdus pacifica]